METRSQTSAGRGRGSRGRYFYRGGRGGRGFNRRNQSGNEKSTKTTEIKFHLHGAGKDKQPCSYNKVLEKITLRIQQTFKNGSLISESLEKDKKKGPNEPERKESMKTDPDEKEFEQKSFDKLYDKQVEIYLEQCTEFEENWKKAYAFVYEQYCGKEMQISLKELPEFDSKIKGDPLELLKQVKVLMHTPIRARYPYLTLTENVTSLLNMRQNESETLIEYLERFEQEKNVVKNQLGKNVLDKFIESCPEYGDLSEDEQKEAKSKAFDAWMAAVFLRGSDQSV